MAQRANRAGLAFLFGTAAGVVGTAVLVAAVGLSAPAWAAAATGFIAAYAVSEILKPYKDDLFAKKPELFGHYSNN